MDQIAQLAFGRILRMAARPEQEGDGAEYERCKAIIMDAIGGDECRDPASAAPLPGWNFGAGATGCVE